MGRDPDDDDEGTLGLADLDDDERDDLVELLDAETAKFLARKGMTHAPGDASRLFSPAKPPPPPAATVVVRLPDPPAAVSLAPAPAAAAPKPGTEEARQTDVIDSRVPGTSIGPDIGRI